jgi:TonB-linked SusC/RagA family outer membrane protein
MKKNLLSLLFLSLLALSSAFAQSRKITGTITGADDGQPLPGVSVKVQGTTIGTQSDAQGNYSLNAPSTAKALIFTYIGYSSQTVSIGARTSISVKLVQDAKALSEVQITTGYNTEKISNITGSVAVVGGKEIEDLPVQSFDKALQGRAAGVQVTSASGQPGGGVNIVIRGVATIQGSTTPLYIIDGVQVSPGGLSTISSQNVLADINPADIESIEVLKDAGSASIYGSQASNGVVIVTTKQGKAGQTKVRASAQYGYNTELNPYKTLNADQWYQLQREGTVNKALRTGNSVGAAVAAINTTYFGSAADPVGNIPTYDWYNAIFRKGKTADFNLSFSGGDANNKYFVSGSYEATDGTIIASKFTRGTLRANLNSKVSKLVSTELSLNISADKTIGPTTGQGFFTNTPFTGALFTPPFNPIYNTDGTFNVAPYPYGGNLVQELNQELRQTGSFQTISHFALNFEPIKGLVARAFAGVEFADGLPPGNYSNLCCERWYRK